jgi:hypothetical protein
MPSRKSDNLIKHYQKLAVILLVFGNRDNIGAHNAPVGQLDDRTFYWESPVTVAPVMVINPRFRGMNVITLDGVAASQMRVAWGAGVRWRLKVTSINAIGCRADSGQLCAWIVP